MQQFGKRQANIIELPICLVHLLWGFMTECLKTSRNFDLLWWEHQETHPSCWYICVLSVYILHFLLYSFYWSILMSGLALLALYSTLLTSTEECIVPSSSCISVNISYLRNFRYDMELFLQTEFRVLIFFVVLLQNQDHK